MPSDQERILSALDALADPKAYAAVYATPSANPCPIEGCVLSVEEHHRLNYGMLTELRALREFKRAIESGATLYRITD